MAEAATDLVGESPVSTNNDAPLDDAQLADVLVEEVSIDGMCGVY